jgi:hypothetical protein
MPIYKKILQISLLIATFTSIPSYAKSVGETFTCHFGRYGTVMIDTREPGETVTINGQRHAALPGSYWFGLADNQDVTLFFGPNMKFWDYVDSRTSPDNKGIRDKHCTRRANKK